MAIRDNQTGFGHNESSEDHPGYFQNKSHCNFVIILQNNN